MFTLRYVVSSAKFDWRAAREDGRHAFHEGSPVRIEFVGLPGAGKSTLARVLGGRLKEAGSTCLESPSFATIGRTPVASGGERLWRACVDLVQGAKLTVGLGPVWVKILPHTRNLHPFVRYWRLIRIWAGLNRLDQNSHSSWTHTIQIFDQGILQCLPSIYPPLIDKQQMSEITGWAIQAMLPVLPQVVVIVGVDPATAVARIRSRPYQKTSWDLADPRLEARLAPQQLYTEEVLPTRLAGIGIPVVRVRGDVPPAEGVESILRVMMEARRKR